MRAVVLGCLLASTIAFIGADAQNSCSVNVTQVEDCAATYASAAPSDICGAMHTYSSCVGDIFACNVTHFASEWANAITPYRSIWESHCNTTTVPGIDAVAETSLVFGDPHYQLTDGTFQSCNSTGSFYYAVSKYYTVTVVQSSIGSLPVNVTEVGTAVTSVTVQVYHPGVRSSSFTWTTGSTAGNYHEGGIAVRPAGIRADHLGLNLKITQSGSNYLLVAGLTKKLVGGIVLNGCEAENKADLPDVSTVTGPCARLPTAYQASCAYDAARTTETWAVAAATAAAAEKTILNNWAYNQNGASSVALLSAAAIAVSALLAMMA